MDRIVVSAQALAERAVQAARTLTRNGEAADDHQVVVERVAYAATEARAIHELADTPAPLADAAHAAAGELAASLRYRLEPIAGVLGLGDIRYDEATRAEIEAAIAPSAVEPVGA